MNKGTVKDLALSLLSEGKNIRIKAHGYSMYPCIKPGSLLLIEPVKLKGFPKIGEIVAIKRGNGLVVHRICRIVQKSNTTFYIARGDSNAFTDNPVKIDKIAGRIIRAETTGENVEIADIRINTKPRYILNRIRVIALMINKRIRLKAKSIRM